MESGMSESFLRSDPADIAATEQSKTEQQNIEQPFNQLPLQLFNQAGRKPGNRGKVGGDCENFTGNDL